MKKKSAVKAAATFKQSVESIEQFLKDLTQWNLTDAHVTWAHEYAVIRLYREFEHMVLHCLVAAINNNTAQLSKMTGITFPKHLTDEVCEYVIVRNGYFDFKGRDGLISTLMKYLPANHYVVTIFKKPTYKDALERLSILRNFAAHNSGRSKKQALSTLGAKRLSSSGAWLKKQGRFGALAEQFKDLADNVASRAPY